MQKKQGGKLKWIIIVIVIVAIIGAAAGGRGNNEVKDVTSNKKEDSQDTGTEIQNEEIETESEIESEEKTEFYVGETAEQEGIQITLVNVTESVGEGFIKPEEGNVFLICEFEILNNSDRDINISSMVNFEAYCDDYSVNQDIIGLQTAEAEGKNQLDGSVAAGKKMNGIIAYQVPSDYHTMEVNVSPDFWSNKDIKFIYNK